MIIKRKSEITIYQDETVVANSKNLKGHIFYFIPDKVEIIEETPLFGSNKFIVKPPQLLFQEIMRIRSKWNSNHKFHHNKISGRKWQKKNSAEKEIVNLAVESLKKFNTNQFKYPLFCKFAIIYYPKIKDISNYGGDNKKEKLLRYDETLLRFLLKGAIHFLYNENDKVLIKKIICDGESSYRNLNKDRILKRIIFDDIIGKSPLRKYVKISEKAEIVHQNSDHNKFEYERNSFINANFLQLADMILGSVNHSCFTGINQDKRILKIGEKIFDKKGIISVPIYELLNKRKRGRNFVHSSHYNTFTISKAYIKNGKWQFENINTKEQITFDNKKILKLFE